MLPSAVTLLPTPAVNDDQQRIIDRSEVDAESGCWLWTGWTNEAATPYGRLSIGNVKVYAHRASYEAFIGLIPQGHEIDHLCQSSLCVNPEHLEAVTPEENRDRVTQRRTHCKRGHEFTEENTYWVRPGARACQACRAWQDKVQKARKKGAPEPEPPLLPTPVTNDMGEGKTVDAWDEWTAKMQAAHGNGNGHGKSLAIEAQRLLPTPRSQHGEDRNNHIWERPADQPQNLENALAHVPAVAAQLRGDTDALSTEGGPGEGLRDVRCAACEEAIRERSARGPGSVPASALLLSELREQEDGSDTVGPCVACAEAHEAGVRALRDDEAAARTSQGPGLGERRPGESADAVPLVSSQTALAGGSAAAHGCCEASTRDGGCPWGVYSAAIHRWEMVLGRVAPPPTIPSKRGTPQLNPVFSEFLMGLPEGHVTAVPGLSRNDMLKALGNGVVPAQAAAAVRFLLNVSEAAA